jgi:hypothetical protein
MSMVPPTVPSISEPISSEKEPPVRDHGELPLVKKLVSNAATSAVLPLKIST